jgi:hypothetical protein
MLVERFVRQPDNSWNLTAFSNSTRPFELLTVPVKLPFEAIYNYVKFPASNLNETQPIEG